MLNRRQAAAGLIASGFAAGAARAQPAQTLAQLEASVRGRLGVFAVRDGRVLLQHRQAERFPMCSTFKATLAAAVLQRVDRGQEQLAREVAFTTADILPNSPTLQAHLAEGRISVEALCQAVIQVSDNAGANLLLRTVGGPAGLTRFWRSIGDRVTRLDRYELALNEATPGDPRDTTSPAAMAQTMRTLVLGRALSPASRTRFTDWLIGTRTGLARLRAGLPDGWRAGDKTGTGARGSTNDIAILWPPVGSPIAVAAYLTESDAPEADRQAVLASVGRLVAAAVA